MGRVEMKHGVSQGTAQIDPPRPSSTATVAEIETFVRCGSVSDRRGHSARVGGRDRLDDGDFGDAYPADLSDSLPDAELAHDTDEDLEMGGYGEYGDPDEDCEDEA